MRNMTAVTAYFLLDGDISQMATMEARLRAVGFRLYRSTSGTYPGFPRDEEAEYQRALRYLFENRVPGWWNQRMVDRQICTQEEFDKALNVAAAEPDPVTPPSLVAEYLQNIGLPPGKSAARQDYRPSTQALVAGAKAYAAEMQSRGFNRIDFIVGLDALLNGDDPEAAMQASYDRRHAPKVDGKIVDGHYLVKLAPTDWWKAVTLQGGRATGRWIAGETDAAAIEGEWRGPMPADHIDQIEATTDHSGRLFRTPHFDPDNP
jgi:hypothetical protein